MTTPEDPRDTWRTPKNLRAQILARFPIGLDCAADSTNAIVPKFYDSTTDGLSRPWLRGPDEFNFFNPPFSNLYGWAEKAAQEQTLGARSVGLFPAHRTEQRWFHEFVIGVAHSVWFLAPRVAYEPPPGIKLSSPRFGSLIVVWAPKENDHTLIGGWKWKT